MVLDGGVADISRSRTIAAQPREIWDILADFGALSSWADGVDHSCVLNHGPNGALLGTTRRVQVGGNALIERITEFDAPTTLAYDIEGLPTRLRNVANRWTLQPDGDATVVRLTSTIEVGTGRPAQMLQWVALRALAKQSDAMLAGLANRLEQTHA
ncbi:Polyketide cyclase / dehydrase and lipid transport [Mycobacterium basiliense]|uniref:Polyketide cyclase / dehydrase and lipid transport n=1 Tax=Mycobacterium basiliense TaxID=2094119 RepID=A0A3S4BGQ7_9MYCO|nr:SRPBCC family protein [Mycobacterium basiliense]VDM87855.1 Polyketide cyclase / dehydrase and lipid transport [Mycobacterium basiliense]